MPHSRRESPVLVTLALCFSLCAACALEGAGAGQAPDASYSTVKPVERYCAVLPVPPFDSSAEHLAELDLVYRANRKAGAAEREAASSMFDFRFSAFVAFFEPALGPATFDEGGFPVTYAFLERAATRSQAVCDGVKEHFKRPRPPHFDARIRPMDKGNLNRRSFPSGHAFRGYFIALVLAEVFPDRRDAILRRGMDIGWGRIVAGVHHPSDISAARTLAAIVFQDMKDSADFASELGRAKEEARKASR